MPSVSSSSGRPASTVRTRLANGSSIRSRVPRAGGRTRTRTEALDELAGHLDDGRARVAHCGQRNRVCASRCRYVPMPAISIEYQRAPLRMT